MIESFCRRLEKGTPEPQQAYREAGENVVGFQPSRWPWAKAISRAARKRRSSRTR